MYQILGFFGCQLSGLFIAGPVFLLGRNTPNVVQYTGQLDCRSRNNSRLGEDVTRSNIVIIPKMAPFDSSKAVKTSFFTMIDNSHHFVFVQLRTFLVQFLADIMHWEILFQPSCPNVVHVSLRNSEHLSVVLVLLRIW